MKRVVVESPYGSKDPRVVMRNVAYARACVHDCILRGESPIASHLLLTQPGVLDDNNPEQRKRGIAAGHAWIAVSDYVAVYRDLGFSSGMEEGIAIARSLSRPLMYRNIEILCAHCSQPAVCFGQYEDPESEPAFACGTCCAHGNEDGWCIPYETQPHPAHP